MKKLILFIIFSLIVSCGKTEEGERGCLGNCSLLPETPIVLEEPVEETSKNDETYNTTIINNTNYYCTKNNKFCYKKINNGKSKKN